MNGTPIDRSMAAILVLALFAVAMLFWRNPVSFERTGPVAGFENRYARRLRRIGEAMVKRRRESPVSGLVAVAWLGWAAIAIASGPGWALNDAAAAVAVLGWWRAAVLHRAAHAGDIVGSPSPLMWAGLGCAVVAVMLSELFWNTIGMSPLAYCVQCLIALASGVSGALVPTVPQSLDRVAARAYADRIADQRIGLLVLIVASVLIETPGFAVTCVPGPAFAAYSAMMGAAALALLCVLRSPSIAALNRELATPSDRRGTPRSPR